MTHADIALYAALALCSGLVIGLTWGAITSFARALLN